MLNGNFDALSKLPVMAISGNHETTYRNGSNEIFKHFNYKIPKQESTSKGFFYSFTYGNVKFIMLNTNDLTASNKLKTEQYDWLIQELENNTQAWTIVSMHHPMYSSFGENAARNELAFALCEQLQGVFVEYGVDIVLQAHDHVISRTYPIDANGQPQTEVWEMDNGINYTINPNGVLYLMNGVSGGENWREPCPENEALFQYYSKSKVATWAQFEITGNTLEVAINYYESGQIKNYQTWGIKKVSEYD